jgi:AcrR family transcriptional regulator
MRGYNVKEPAMVRRGTPASRQPPEASPCNTGREGNPREKIIAALMARLAEAPFEEIGLADIAARAGVTLSELRALFGSKLAIFAAYLKNIDRTVLSGGEAEMTEEPPRERLFDVLMRRLEALAGEREAIRSLMRSARRNPALAMALNALSVSSQRWMLAAANVSASGMRAQGLALLFASVLRTFVNDDDPGLARTMAALDRALDRGQRWLSYLEDLCLLAPPLFCRPGRRAHNRDRYARGDESPADAG